MANDYSGYSDANGYAGFNYTNEQAKLARQQAAAQQLQALALKQSQPSYVQNNMGTFYAGGNGKVGAMSQVLAALLANKSNADNDTSQKGLDSTSQAALAYNLDPNNAPSVRSAVAAQQADEDAAQLQRELNRWSTPAPVDPSAQTSSDAQQPAPENAPGVETMPVSPQAPNNAVPLPSADGSSQVAGLSSAQVAALSALKPDPNAMPGRGTGNGGPTASELAIWNAKQAGTDPLADFRARELAQTKKNNALINSPFPSVKAPPPPPIVYQTTATQAAAQAAAQAAQPQPKPQPAPQVPAPMPAAQPAPVPVAPDPVPPPDSSYLGDPRMAKQVAADNALANQTPADHIKQLIAISNTGPLGQQIAGAQLNQMFSSKNGRFSTDVKADTVNGGFVAVTTDSQTGQITNIKPINAGTATLITGQTTDGEGKRWNVHKDGTTTAMLDSSGKPIIDPSVKKSNDEFNQRTSEAVAKNKAAIGAIDSTLQRLDTIDALSDQYGGPLNSVVPDKIATHGLRTYRSLIGQDVFSGVRDAVNAGGEGSPRFTQGEFSHFENNGGLNPDMKPETVKELTAQQRTALMAKRDALLQYGQSLPMPQANPTPSIPTRQPGSPPSQLSYSQFTGGR